MTTGRGFQTVRRIEFLIGRSRLFNWFQAGNFKARRRLGMTRKPTYRWITHLFCGLALVLGAFGAAARIDQAAAAPAVATVTSFEPLGLGPGGVQSRAWDVSADGSVVVGIFWTQESFFFPSHAYRWTSGTFQDLGTLKPDAQEAEAYAVSDDGSKIVGWARGLSGFQRPFVWTAATGMQELSNVPGSDAKATDISGDGTTIVGSFYVDAEGSWQAFQWKDGVVTDLGFLIGGSDSKGQAVCALGGAAVGSTLDSAGIQKAFRWRNGTMQDLGGVGRNNLAYAEGCSDNGNIVIGTSTNDKGNQLATRWGANGARSLGTLGGNSSEAHATSADGSIVVGGAGLPFVNGTSEYSAFRWSSATGRTEQLSRVLQSLGVSTPFCHQVPCPVGTWFLEFALGVSSDGSVIVGDAVDPNGNSQAFRAVIGANSSGPTPTIAPPTATRAATSIAPSPTPALPTATRTAVPPTATTAVDTISIQLAEYSAGNRELRVEATSSSATATLKVYVTSANTLIGTLTNEGGGRYRGNLAWSTNPQNITVQSSLGGVASSTVILK
jgi:probable HAF family extracellular repeat protein